MTRIAVVGGGLQGAGGGLPGPPGGLGGRCCSTGVRTCRPAGLPTPSLQADAADPAVLDRAALPRTSTWCSPRWRTPRRWPPWPVRRARAAPAPPGLRPGGLRGVLLQAGLQPPVPQLGLPLPRPWPECGLPVMVKPDAAAAAAGCGCSPTPGNWSWRWRPGSWKGWVKVGRATAAPRRWRGAQRRPPIRRAAAGRSRSTWRVLPIRSRCSGLPGQHRPAAGDRSGHGRRLRLQAGAGAHRLPPQLVAALERQPPAWPQRCGCAA